jgi:hypothetical protein
MPSPPQVVFSSWKKKIAVACVVLRMLWRCNDATCFNAFLSSWKCIWIYLKVNNR